MKFVASVVTKDGTFRRTVISPLHRADTADHDERDQDREHDRHSEVVEPVLDPRREQEDLTGRQVDLGEHEQQHLSDGDGRDRPRVAGGRAEAERVGEGRPRPDREVDEQADRDHERRQLALVEEERAGSAAPSDEACCRCPGGSAAGAAVGVGAPDCTLAATSAGSRPAASASAASSSFPRTCSSPGTARRST